MGLGLKGVALLDYLSMRVLVLVVLGYPASIAGFGVVGSA